MRLIIASMKHETNTFSPVPTGLERFRERVLCFDEEVPAALEGTKTGVGAFLQLAREAGAEIVTPVAAEASPSCPVTAEAYSRITDAICDAVAGGTRRLRIHVHSVGDCVVLHGAPRPTTPLASRSRDGEREGGGRC